MLDHEVDWQAALQIRQLFQAQDCHVWELLDTPPAEDAVPIRRADGDIVAYGRPVTGPRRLRLALLIP
jgi:hypothetical protein